MTINQEISIELKNWLEQRKIALNVKAKIYEDGGHMMLKSSSYDPESLEEPLRSEAIAYFERLKNK